MNDVDTNSIYNSLSPQIKLGAHISHIYSTQEHQFDIVNSFIKEGLEQNQKCIYIIDEGKTDDLILQLRKFGIDVDSVLQKGQLVFFYGDDFRGSSEYITPDTIIDFWKKELDATLMEGYDALRGIGEMPWALKALKSKKEFVEFEAKINHLFEGNRLIALCLFDETKFAEGLIVAALQTHPIVVYNNKVHRKRYYIPPDLLLRRLDQDLMYLYGIEDNSD
ncbi:MAG: MEDS domain-containing protein [Candidatus Lokiarchaeota archaeon]|nr:MEDS domain-containing protein [Candidatus Lokiarchaeota archaeon]